MALPTNTDVTTLDYKWRGTPFCRTSGSTSVDMNTMDYKWRGTPFVGNPYPASAVRTRVQAFIFG